LLRSAFLIPLSFGCFLSLNFFVFSLLPLARYADLSCPYRSFSQSPLPRSRSQPVRWRAPRGSKRREHRNTPGRGSTAAIPVPGFASPSAVASRQLIRIRPARAGFRPRRGICVLLCAASRSPIGPPPRLPARALLRAPPRGSHNVARSCRPPSTRSTSGQALHTNKRFHQQKPRGSSFQWLQGSRARCRPAKTLIIPKHGHAVACAVPSSRAGGHQDPLPQWRFRLSSQVVTRGRYADHIGGAATMSRLANSASSTSSIKPPS